MPSPLLLYNSAATLTVDAYGSSITAVAIDSVRVDYCAFHTCCCRIYAHSSHSSRHILSCMPVLYKAWMAFVLGAFQLYPTSEHTAACASPHKRGAGRVADRPDGSEVREDGKKKHAKTYAMSADYAPKRSHSTVCRRSVVDSDVEASRRR